ncbi:hypothetical protein AEAC466_20715 [Asticcacaulis sp. AC466]|uniref:hypothetical protein n=1 Tax=Asticcacaulis sp. AC466 TaxID=1282362 RepID=UPI0003C40871|nr:hypothetical protein [Asticcacaulis sp. AC466]ESQ81720.1 hypothetical protein AEAC466_20715 [Asticcacaulis sp. AC466]
MKPSLLIFSLLLTATSAAAGDLATIVTDTAGKPVPNAVVTFTPDSGASMPAAEKSKAFVMAQKNVQFVPYVLAVPAGTTVAFPNEDRVNHHVYSFSPIAKFQFPLYGKGKSRSMTFTQPGTVALGCNIHDSMAAYIRVVSTPYYATTDGAGRVMLKLPDTAGSLAVWHPNMDAPDHQIARSIAKTSGSQAFSVKVHLPAPTAGQY